MFVLIETYNDIQTRTSLYFAEPNVHFVLVFDMKIYLDTFCDYNFLVHRCQQNFITTLDHLSFEVFIVLTGNSKISGFILNLLAKPIKFISMYVYKDGQS